jgi:hypothetical protein
MSIFVYERYLSMDEKITSTLGICGKNSLFLSNGRKT